MREYHILAASFELLLILLLRFSRLFVVEQISTLLLAELKNGGLAGQLYIESLTNLLAVQLVREQITVQPCRVLYEGGLSDRQLRRVTDYINENLAQDLQSDLVSCWK